MRGAYNGTPARAGACGRHGHREEEVMRRAFLLLFLPLVLACNGRDAIKDVTIYPTYGYEDGTQWKIPMRVWELNYLPLENRNRNPKFEQSPGEDQKTFHRPQL